MFKLVYILINFTNPEINNPKIYKIQTSSLYKNKFKT